MESCDHLQHWASFYKFHCITPILQRIFQNILHPEIFWVSWKGEITKTEQLNLVCLGCSCFVNVDDVMKYNTLRKHFNHICIVLCRFDGSICIDPGQNALELVKGWLPFTWWSTDSWEWIYCTKVENAYILDLIILRI